MKAACLVLCVISLCCCKTVERNEVVGKKKNANQWEYNDHLVEQYFNQSYMPRQYQKFDGLILKDSLDEFNVIYFDSLRLILSEDNEIYRRIFTENILNPKYLYTSQSMNICCIDEFPFLNSNGTRRRFRFLVFEKNFANPLQYLFELTNNNATSETTLAEFLNEAEMTHLSEPTVQI